MNPALAFSRNRIIHIAPKVRFMTGVSKASENPIIEQFKGFYYDIPNTPLDLIEDIYCHDVLFKDPVHEVRGLAELRHYLEQVSANVAHGKFEYLDQLIGKHCAYIKWNMHFSHPKLGHKTIHVRGMSQILFTDHIYYHEDCYDMGALLYEHLPILKSCVGFLKKRISKL